MDDIITLLHPMGVSVVDDDGNETELIERRTVFCSIRSVTRSEYYQAAQQGLHPSVTFVISNPMDYDGEKHIEWIDPRMRTVRYEVIRTYQDPLTGEVELTAEERIRDF